MDFRLGEVILAPLAGYTHSPFRKLLRRLGADRTWTELVSADMILRKGLSDPILLFSPEERPLVIQLFGNDPEKIYRAGEIVARELKPDGLDLNLGCPVRKVASRGAGAGLLRDLARLSACAEALVSAGKAYGIPVSAKIRLGWDRDILEEIAERLVAAGVSAIVLHPRLAVEGFSGRARWERIRDLVKLAGEEIPIIGNGDVLTWEDIERLFRETGCHAVMVGRAALRNPWIFEEYQRKQSLSRGVSLRAALARELLEEMGRFFRPETAAKKIKAFLAQLFKGIPGKKTFLPDLLTAPDYRTLIIRLKDLQSQTISGQIGYNSYKIQAEA